MSFDILKLLGLFTAFVEGGVKDNRQFYKDHVGPLFSAMDRVHNDYLKSFAAARAKVDSGDATADEEAYHMLRERQIDMRTTKDKIVVEAATARIDASRHMASEALAFYETCLRYFGIGEKMEDDLKTKNYSSWYAQMLGDDTAHDCEFRIPAQRTLESIEPQIKALWLDVAEAHAICRRELLR